MASLPNLPEPEPARRGITLLPVAVSSLPVLALTVGIPFANRLEPRILGLPLLLAWIVGWIILTPVCMAIVHWLDRHRR